MKKTAQWFLVALLALTLLLTGCSQPTTETLPITAPVQTPAQTTTEEEEPHVVSTASVGVVGDILIHSAVFTAAHRGNGVYDFTENYQYVAPYLEKYDYAIANLEVPLAGGSPSTYPRFNSPDSLADALKGAGVDMFLTANNHSNDRGESGYFRTLSVLKEKGIDALGTRASEEETPYPVKVINGIPIGMACFTYSTVYDGRTALNGLTCSAKVSPLVSAFVKRDLEPFFAEAARAISLMKENGAEFIMFFMHWGEEYQDSYNSNQRTIAEKLCELGVDVIVGGHPHVIQPMETIVAENGNQTLCVYSTGNFISNQRKEEMVQSDKSRGFTEDGIIFGVTFEKWSTGEYRIREVEVMPTWVLKEWRTTPQGRRYVYHIIPLDQNVADWTEFSLNENTIAQAKASYKRTMSRLGEGINAARTELGLSVMPMEI